MSGRAPLATTSISNRCSPLTPTLSPQAGRGSRGGAAAGEGQMRRVGIHVGGTNTDAVLLQDGRGLDAGETPTTEDVTGGIVTALGLLSNHPEVARGAIGGVVIGTT